MTDTRISKLTEERGKRATVQEKNMKNVKQDRRRGLKKKKKERDK